MSNNHRLQTHENSREEIKNIALQQLGQCGAPGLSLGAIAREMGVTTPALYRYFKSRDALLAELTADAFTSLTECLREVKNLTAPSEPGKCIRVLSLAYRKWAIAHPQQYSLMFEAPVSGYEMDRNAGEAADQSFLILLEVISAADQSKEIKPGSEELRLPALLAAQLKAVKHHYGAYSEKITYLSLSLWSFLHGMTSLELSQRYAVILQDYSDVFFEFELDRYLQSLGLNG